MSEMANMPGEMDEWTPEMQAGDNPCWQDLYDDDCSMTSVFSASFVASTWIKSMPCGAGIEVRRLHLVVAKGDRYSFSHHHVFNLGLRYA
jgi:hypothetical protein